MTTVNETLIQKIEAAATALAELAELLRAENLPMPEQVLEVLKVEEPKAVEVKVEKVTTSSCTHGNGKCNIGTNCREQARENEKVKYLGRIADLKLKVEDSDESPLFKLVEDASFSYPGKVYLRPATQAELKKLKLTDLKDYFFQARDGFADADLLN